MQFQATIYWFAIPTRGLPVWRCPRCWQTQARERVEDPRPLQKPDARFVYNPVENVVLRRSAMTALAAAERWRVRASRVAQGRAQPPDGGLARLQRLGASG